MIKNSYRYARQLVEGDLFLQDTKNEYVFVSQRPFKGKVDSSGNTIIDPGANITLQILTDASEPIIDRKTGEVKDNNELETFDVTIEGCTYPLNFKKGDHVSLAGFVAEHSYYVDYNLILRFKKIYRSEDK